MSSRADGRLFGKPRTCESPMQSSRFDEPVLAPTTVPLLPIVREWMSQIGKKGGSKRSEAKTASCRLNARKPRRKK
jgi:hypothetical protein